MKIETLNTDPDIVQYIEINCSRMYEAKRSIENAESIGQLAGRKEL